MEGLKSVLFLKKTQVQLTECIWAMLNTTAAAGDLMPSSSLHRHDCIHVIMHACTHTHTQNTPVINNCIKNCEFYSEFVHS